MNVRCLVFIVSAVGLLPMVLWAESAEQIIAKARAYLGSEKALQAVRTIHFTGALEIDAHNLGRLVKTETESRREIAQ